MRDYRDIEVQKSLKRPLDICIVTYNRPYYLKKCIWSIIASTKMPYRIFVIDDNSKDEETKPFLEDMLRRELIHEVIFNKENMGTAKNFNMIIDASDEPMFVMANDDMYFHRYWDFAAMDIYNNYLDCGIVTFYDYSRYNLDEGVERVGKYVFEVPRTGMGATLVNRELYKKAGKFNLPRKKIMGFFATKFCEATSHVHMTRKIHYATIPSYASHMDFNHSRLNERENEENDGYSDHRRFHKLNKNLNINLNK